MLELTPNLQTPVSQPAFIREATTQTFEKEVLEASKSKPVIVDLWAPWCEPCKQLMPVLERLVTQAGGAVELVKVNIDENPDIAQALRVQSVPTVYAFFQAQPVDGFSGAQPESSLKAFVDKLVKLSQEQGGAENNALAEKLDSILEQANAFLWDGEVQKALSGFDHILQQDENHGRALEGMSLCLMAMGESEAAQEVLQTLETGALETGDAAKQHTPKTARFFLDMQELSAHLPPAEELEQKLAADKADHQSRYDLAQHLLARMQPAAAV